MIAPLPPAGGGGPADLQGLAAAQNLTQVGEPHPRGGSLPEEFRQKAGPFEPPVPEQFRIEGGHQEGGAIDRGGQVVEQGRTALKVGSGVLDHPFGRAPGGIGLFLIE